MNSYIRYLVEKAEEYVKEKRKYRYINLKRKNEILETYSTIRYALDTKAARAHRYALHCYTLKEICGKLYEKEGEVKPNTAGARLRRAKQKMVEEFKRRFDRGEFDFL